MIKDRITFVGNLFPGIGLGLVVSYENGIIYIMGSLLCFQFYMDVNIL